METIFDISQLDYFTLIGFAIFLIAIGLILPTYIVKEKRKELHKNFWIVPQTVTKKDSIPRNEKN